MLDEINDLNNPDLSLISQKKKKKPLDLMDELYPEIPTELDITERQRNAINHLDLSNRRHVIHSLMRQQGLLAPKEDVLLSARNNLNQSSSIENESTDNNIDKAEQPKQDDSPQQSNYQLGTLSAKYESLKNPAAIGYDNGGRHSYGVFQIETKHGTMKDFLSYLAQNKKYQSFEQKLQSSGGYAGALNKADNFVSAWKELAKNQDFIQSQYQFIFDMKFKPLLRNVAKIEGFDIEKRHPIVKDVLFSIAVQHGQRGAFDLIKNALGSSAKNLSDEALINKLYDERSKVDKYLPQNPKETREKIKQNRYPNERRDALKALKG